MKNRKKIWQCLLNLDIMIASVALIVLVGCTFGGVIMRYVVGKPFGWIEEIQAFLIVWVVFAAGGAAYRTGNHSSIEIVYELLPNFIKGIIRIFIGIVVVGVLSYLCYTSFQYLQLFVQTGRTTSVLGISYVLIYAIVPLSCIIQIFNYFLVNVFGYEDEKENLLEETNE